MENSRRVTLQQELVAKFGASVKVDEPLAAHTSYKIGGPAFAWITPATSQELSGVILWCIDNEMRYFVMGGGSNVLCDSRGYEGVVIHLGAPAFRSIMFEDDVCVAGGGALLRNVVEESLDASYCNLAYMGGIPGTLGGAVAMNAGTREHWVDSIVQRVEAVSLSSGELFNWAHDDVAWSYRSSSLRDAYIITRVWLGPLVRGNVDEARAEMKRAFERRKASQPLSLPNAGSVFKNPEGQSSGALIEGCGLKGYVLGGAQVSEKHANFIVNTGNASSDDVRSLVEHIQEEVYKRYGIKLQTEIRFLLNR